MELEVLLDEAERNQSDATLWCRLGEAIAGTAAHSLAPERERAASIAALMHAASIATSSDVLSRVANILTDLDALDGALDTSLRLSGSGGDRAAELCARLTAKLLAADRADDALKLLLDAGSLVLEDPRLAVLRARAYHASGDPAAALIDVELALKGKSDFFDAHLLKSQLLVALNRREESINSWQAAVQLRPEDPAPALGLGETLAAIGRRDEAIKVLATASQRMPGSSEALIALAHVLRSVHRNEDAERALRRAVSLDPDRAKPHFELGQLLEDAERYEEAAASYREALRREVNVPSLLRSSYVLQRIGRIPEAVDAWMKAAAMRPEDPEARNQITRALTPLRTSSAVTGGGAFAGQLSGFSVWEVLEILINRRSTGRLELTGVRSRADVYLREGSVVRVAAKEQPALYEVMKTMPGIDPVGLAAALSGVDRENDAAIAHHIGQSAILDATGLKNALETQVRMGLEKLVDWSNGTFTFHQQVIDPRSTDVDIDLRYLLLEIFRRRDEDARPTA